MRLYNKYSNFILILFLVIISIISKYQYILSAEYRLDSDQAIPLLMSRRILSGVEFPFFFWGQNYMGMTEVWFSLPIQYIFGSNIEVFIISQMILSILISFSLYYFFYLSNHKYLGVVTSISFQFGHPFLNSHLINTCENFGSSILLCFFGIYFIIKFHSISLYDFDMEIKKIFHKNLFYYGIILGYSIYTREIIILILPMVIVLYLKYYLIFLKNIRYLLSGIITGYLPGILHYIYIPYTNKLIKPKVVFHNEIHMSVSFF